MAMSAPRPSYSGCAGRKRSTPISFFGISDSRNEGSVRRNPPAGAEAVVSSAGGGGEDDEGITVAATALLGLGPRVVTAATAVVVPKWTGAAQAETARRRRTWAWATGLCSAAAAAEPPCHMRCPDTSRFRDFESF
uniref:Uncharacterized protein n=1 Tax=Arundo donax TaxID=35708 RepID=A0A0A9BN08_ARUDO